MTVRIAAPAGAPPLTLAALRTEIDELDDALLQLLERRQGLARHVGRFKGVEGDGLLPLKPDREHHVLTRLLRRAKPETRDLVIAVWREVIGAGLAQQQQIEVVVWAGDRPGLLEAARRRFGFPVPCSPAASPAEALEAAATRSAIAVLALGPGSPWWVELAADHPELCVFDALGARAPADPAALVVGRIDPKALAGEVVYRVSTGGDAGAGAARERLLGSTRGARLYAVEGSRGGALERARGFIGRAPALPGA
jgi:chorismate mutase